MTGPISGRSARGSASDARLEPAGLPGYERWPAPAEVESLLVEADARARDRVCEELAERLAEAYRAAVADRLAERVERVPAPPERGPDDVAACPTAGPAADVTDSEARDAEPAAGPAADVTDSAAGTAESASGSAEVAWYVYAVVREADARTLADLPGLVGVEDRQAELVPADGLAVAAAEVPLAGFRASGDEPDLSAAGWLHQALRAHERVVERICGRATALPFRFGALYPSRDHLRAILRTHGDQLTEELDRLDGTAEWGVRAGVEADVEAGVEARATVPMPTQEADHEEPPEDVDGTAWMLRRRDAAAGRERTRRWRARIAADVNTVLSRTARETQVRASSRPQDEGAKVLDAVYLVAHAREAAFHDALGSLGDRYAAEGVRFEVTGPWPPYHFVRLPGDLPPAQSPTATGAMPATEAMPENAPTQDVRTQEAQTPDAQTPDAQTPDAQTQKVQTQTGVRR